MSATTQEIWKTVTSLPLVEVSNFGRIRAKEHMKKLPKGGECLIKHEGSVGQWDGKRYIYCFRKKNFKVARLVCETFNGLPPIGKNVCMHIDENSRNNRPENLKWGTQKENLNAPGFIAYCRSRTGDNNPHIKGKLKNEFARY